LLGKLKIYKMYLLFFITVPIYADSILVNIENDIINGTDQHLTNNFNLSYMSDLNNTDFEYFALQLNHEIYTPKNLESKNTEDYDIPYAGHLALEFLLYKVYPQYFYSFGMSLGTIGKYAIAKEVQTEVHSLFDNSAPEGWDNQIGDKTTFGVSALFAYKTPKKEFLFNDIELNTHAYLNIGNYQRIASIGSLIRYGDDYTDNFEVIDHDSASQLNLPKKFVDLAWSISAGVVFEYNDYIYILDEYKEQYHINRDKGFLGGVANFDLYYATSKLSISLRIRDINLNPKSISQKWIGISYLYAF